MPKEYHYCWELHLKSSPELLWPFVADTNRFNRDTGLPEVERLEIRNGISRMRFKHIPAALVEWEEKPFEWIYPYRFSIERDYRKGPLAQLRVLCELIPEEGGTLLRYQVWAQARNMLGDLAIPLVIGLVSGQMFRRVFQRYDALAGVGKTPLDVPGSGRLAIGGAQRLKEAARQFVQAGVDPSLVNRLTHLLQHADELSLLRIRPFALADRWGVERRKTLEMFLLATRLGVLDAHWELLCPMCRGSVESHSSLTQIHAHNECPSCQIAFEASFDLQVEIVFRPNPAVRVVDDQMLFCVGSPQRQPHIRLVQRVPARESRCVPVLLEKGVYLLRSRLGNARLHALRSGPDQVNISTEDLPAEAEIRIGLSPLVCLYNRQLIDIDFILEEGEWSDQAATAMDVTTLQIFRDLFAEETLRAGEMFSVGSVTLLFTDLRDSTRIYSQIGDAPAFARVMKHFDILREQIARQGGAMVKTMGDAVMAVFRQPLEALLTIQRAHNELTRLEGVPPLYLKAGVHRGPCLVITLNDRLDYFGSTVNLAARLPLFSQGADIVFSEQVAVDPQVDEWLSEQRNRISLFQAEIKGFEHPFRLWRLTL